MRVRSPDDRRKIVIELTAGNNAMHAVYEEVSREMTRIFYAGIAPGDIAGFERTLEHILENLVSYEAQR